jgi:hypothetical protein
VRGDVPENGNEHRHHQQVIADKEDVFKRPGYSAADPRRKSGAGKVYRIPTDAAEKLRRNSTPVRAVYAGEGFSFECCNCGDGTEVINKSTCDCNHTICGNCYSSWSVWDSEIGKTKGPRDWKYERGRR